MTDEMNMCFEECKKEMQKSIDHLDKELVKIRAGKANATMLDGVMVDYYGNMSPINQVSNVKVSDARTLLVIPMGKNHDRTH